MDPLDLLKADLKEDDIEQVVLSISRIKLIALALGPERTRRDLIPYLQEYTSVDRDEAQAALARQLGDLVDLCGGSEHASILLPILEIQAGLEETLIREAAVGSLCKVIPRLPAKEVLAKVYPMIKRLIGGEFFPTRVSVAGIFAATYPMVPDEVQVDLRTMFKGLCTDETPMIRKAAFISLSDLVQYFPKELILSEFLPLVKSLSEDDVDHMRLHSIECCAAIAARFDPLENVQYIHPIIHALQDDGSWRVRQQLCRTFEKLCERFGEEQASDKLLPIYVKFLTDNEPQVRFCAINILYRIACLCKQGLHEHFSTPVLESLATDPSEKVRGTFAKILPSLCGPYGKEASQKILIPVIQQLTKDELAEVRDSVISELHTLAKDLGPDAALDIVLPTLQALSKDMKWRVRMEVIAQIAPLSELLGREVFERKLHPLLVEGLSDHVYAIREVACEQACLLMKSFGVEWALEKILPPAFATFEKSSNYLHRMTSLIIVSHAAPLVSRDVFDKSFVPILLTACKDEVANVRFAAAKTVKQVVNCIDLPILDAQFRPVLTHMTGDSDFDVKYFSEEALKSINEKLAKTAA